jgi:hypothetical protein
VTFEIRRIVRLACNGRMYGIPVAARP